ncbi:alpha/beta fold hydrolase [Polaribacter sp.]|uniref:alpha/beta fold hydrolase n=1 Tax=Polaribacter sp. TaxID=1920175 RepID=UPI003EF37AF9
MNFFKRFFKFVSGFLLVVFVLLYAVFYYFTSPKSDEKILSKFEDSLVKPIITHETFNGFDFRKLSIINNVNFPTVVFVHGTIGSCVDFLAYLKDTELSKKANFISYDRIGYNYEDKNNVQESIGFEARMLQHITENLSTKNTIVVGYSYGGPIVLADTTKYKKVVLLAPAVYSKVEPMPWMIHLYNWKTTRWLVPKIWKQASKEKLSHQRDLRNYEQNWLENPNKIISIHGDDDGIVPYANSEYLKEEFSAEQFTLITIPGAGHSLVWSEFEFIKTAFLKLLE